MKSEELKPDPLIESLEPEEIGTTYSKKKNKAKKRKPKTR